MSGKRLVDVLFWRNFDAKLSVQHLKEHAQKSLAEALRAHRCMVLMLLSDWLWRLPQIAFSSWSHSLSDRLRGGHRSLTFRFRPASTSPPCANRCHLAGNPD